MDWVQSYYVDRFSTVVLWWQILDCVGRFSNLPREVSQNLVMYKKTCMTVAHNRQHRNTNLSLSKSLRVEAFAFGHEVFVDFNRSPRKCCNQYGKESRPNRIRFGRIAILPKLP